MDDYQRNYVYIHQHPESGEVVYVGHGTNERAWRCTSFRDGSEPNYGHRSKDHAEWCQQLIDQGYVPSDWVEIRNRQLAKNDACKIEQDLVRAFNPIFNAPLGKKLLKLSKEQLEEAVKLRQQGGYYNEIACILEVSPMTVWRAMNGKNKNAAY